MINKSHNVIIAGVLPPLHTDFAEEFTYNDLLSTEKWYRLESFKKLSDLVKKNEIDIVQANASITLKYSVISMLLYKWEAKIVYRNASISSKWLRGYFHKLFNKWLLNKTDAIACVSKQSLEDLKINLGINPKRLIHISNGVNKSIKIESNTIEGRKVILHIGAFTFEKNQKGLIRIFSLLNETNTELWLVGEGPLREETESYSKSFKNHSKIRFLGTRKDIPSLMQQATVFALPSLIEGLPGVILEAGMNKLPVIAYDVGSISDIIPEEFSKMLIPLNQEKIFADQLNKVLLDKEFRKRYGESLLGKVSKNFSMDVVSTHFERLYYNLVKK